MSVAKACLNTAESDANASMFGVETRVEPRHESRLAHKVSNETNNVLIDCP